MALSPTSSRGSSSAAASYTLICDSLLAAPAASFDTNTLLAGNIPATYKHLFFVLLASSAAGGPDTSIFTLNGSATSYEYYVARTNTTTGGVTSDYAASNGYLGLCPGNALVGRANAYTATIPNYASTALQKSVTSVGGFPGGLNSGSFVETAATVWKNTAAVTRIVVSLSSASNFVTGCRFTLYGLS